MKKTPWRKGRKVLFKDLYRKILVYIVISSFLFNTTLSFAAQNTTLFGKRSYAQRYIKPETETNLIDIKEDPSAIAIPDSYGQIVEHYKGKGDRLIVLIQDRHVDEVCQINTANILNELAENYDIRLLGLEGASKRLDTAFYNSFPDGKIKEKVSRAFVKEGLFTGAEYLKVTKKDLRLAAFGAEDRGLYLKHFDAYKRIESGHERILSYIAALGKILKSITGAVYSKRLKALDSYAERYMDKDINLSEYAVYLNKTARRLKVNMKAYPDFSNFCSLIRKEKDIDFSKADGQRKRLIEELSHILGEKELGRLLKLSLNFRLNKISAVAFYTYLQAILRKTDLDIEEKDYDELLSYIKYLRLSEKINHLKLFEDAEALNEDIALKLFKTEKEKDAFYFSKGLSLIKDLYNLKLTNKKLAYIKSRPDMFELGRIRDFITDTADSLGMPVTLGKGADTISPRDIKAANRFYEIAVRRDAAMVRNTLKRMPYSSNDAAVLIAGGFHTAGITGILKRRKISYIVICPNLGSGDYDELYSSRMKGRLPSYADILRVAFQMLVPSLTTGDIGGPRHAEEAFAIVFAALEGYENTGQVPDAGALTDGLARIKHGKPLGLESARRLIAGAVKAGRLTGSGLPDAHTAAAVDPAEQLPGGAVKAAPTGLKKMAMAAVVAAAIAGSSLFMPGDAPKSPQAVSSMSAPQLPFGGLDIPRDAVILEAPSLSVAREALGPIQFDNYREDSERVARIINLIFGNRISWEQKRRWQLLMRGTLSTEYNFLNKHKGKGANGTTRYQITGATIKGVIHSYITYPMVIKRKVRGRVKKTTRIVTRKGCKYLKALAEDITGKRWDELFAMSREELRNLAAANADFATFISVLVYNDEFERNSIEVLPEDADELGKLWKENYNKDGVGSVRRFNDRLNRIHPSLSRALEIVHRQSMMYYKELYAKRKDGAEGFTDFTRRGRLSEHLSGRIALLLKDEYGITASNILTKISRPVQMKAAPQFWYSQLLIDHDVYIFAFKTKTGLRISLGVYRSPGEGAKTKKAVIERVDIRGELYDKLKPLFEDAMKARPNRRKIPRKGGWASRHELAPPADRGAILAAASSIAGTIRTAATGMTAANAEWEEVLRKHGLQDVNIEHTRRNVYAIDYFAQRIGLSAEDKDVLNAALWLHDISKDTPIADYMPEENFAQEASTLRLLVHHLESADIAGEVLKSQGRDQAFIKAVREIILAHMGPIKGSIEFDGQELGFMELTRRVNIDKIRASLESSSIAPGRKEQLRRYISMLDGGFPEPDSISDKKIRQLARIARDIDLLDLATYGIGKVFYFRSTGAFGKETAEASFISARQSAIDVKENLLTDAGRELIDSLIERLNGFYEKVADSSGFEAIDLLGTAEEKSEAFNREYESYLGKYPIGYDSVLRGKTVMPEAGAGLRTAATGGSIADMGRIAIELIPHPGEYYRDAASANVDMILRSVGMEPSLDSVILNIGSGGNPIFSGKGAAWDVVNIDKYLTQEYFGGDTFYQGDLLSEYHNFLLRLRDERIGDKRVGAVVFYNMWQYFLNYLPDIYKNRGLSTENQVRLYLNTAWVHVMEKDSLLVLVDYMPPHAPGKISSLPGNETAIGKYKEIMRAVGITAEEYTIVDEASGQEVAVIYRKMPAPPRTAVTGDDLLSIEASSFSKVEALFSDTRMVNDAALGSSNASFGLVVSADTLLAGNASISSRNISVLNMLAVRKSYRGEDKFHIVIDATGDQINDLRERGLYRGIGFIEITRARDRGIIDIAKGLARQTKCVGIITDEDTAAGLKERTDELKEMKLFVRAQQPEDVVIGGIPYEGLVAFNTILLDLLNVFHNFSPGSSYSARDIVNILPPVTSYEFYKKFVEQVENAYRQILSQA